MVKIYQCCTLRQRPSPHTYRWVHTMSEVPGHQVPSKAKVVVIGAGIVGNCLVGHLARLGWTDMVLLDKGPLPNPGGSTGHASNFIFPVDHSREFADITPVSYTHLTLPTSDLV